MKPRNGALVATSEVTVMELILWPAAIGAFIIGGLSQSLRGAVIGALVFGIGVPALFMWRVYAASDQQAECQKQGKAFQPGIIMGCKDR